MKLGMVGLGRMGSNMVRRLIAAGHSCVVFDIDTKTVERLAKQSAMPSDSPLRYKFGGHQEKKP